MIKIFLNKDIEMVCGEVTRSKWWTVEITMKTVRNPFIQEKIARDTMHLGGAHGHCGADCIHQEDCKILSEFEVFS